MRVNLVNVAFCLVLVVVSLNLYSVFAAPPGRIQYSGTYLRSEEPVPRGCLYQDYRYEHGETVRTEQPCLNCTCARGVLLCFLRVCPLLSSPPPGCFTARKEGDCCPSFICSSDKPTGAPETRQTTTPSDLDENETLPSEDYLQLADEVQKGQSITPSFYTSSITIPPDGATYNQSTNEIAKDDPEDQVPELTTILPSMTSSVFPNGVESSSNASVIIVTSTPPSSFLDLEDDFDFDNLNIIRGGCFINGSLYAEGSAILSGSFCEYCYCIRAKPMCIKPKCHLSIENCRPKYSSEFSCCPTSYSCKKNSTTTTSTTTTTETTLHEGSLKVCNFEGKTYQMGDPVISTSSCQNCFCTEDGVKCKDVECSPIMDNCTPVIPEGHCCPIEYMCNATASDNLPLNKDALPKSDKEEEHLKLPESADTTEPSESQLESKNNSSASTSTQYELKETSTSPLPERLPENQDPANPKDEMEINPSESSPLALVALTETPIDNITDYSSSTISYEAPSINSTQTAILDVKPEGTVSLLLTSDHSNHSYVLKLADSKETETLSNVFKLAPNHTDGEATEESVNNSTTSKPDISNLEISTTSKPDISNLEISTTSKPDISNLESTEASTTLNVSHPTIEAVTANETDLPKEQHNVSTNPTNVEPLTINTTTHQDLVTENETSTETYPSSSTSTVLVETDKVIELQKENSEKVQQSLPSSTESIEEESKSTLPSISTMETDFKIETDVKSVADGLLVAEHKMEESHEIRNISETQLNDIAPSTTLLPATEQIRDSTERNHAANVEIPNTETTIKIVEVAHVVTDVPIEISNAHSAISHSNREAVNVSPEQPSTTTTVSSTTTTTTIKTQDDTISDKELNPEFKHVDEGIPLNYPESREEEPFPTRENDRLIYFPEVDAALKGSGDFKRRITDSEDGPSSAQPIYKATQHFPTAPTKILPKIKINGNGWKPITDEPERIRTSTDFNIPVRYNSPKPPPRNQLAPGNYGDPFPLLYYGRIPDYKNTQPVIPGEVPSGPVSYIPGEFDTHPGLQGRISPTYNGAASLHRNPSVRQPVYTRPETNEEEDVEDKSPFGFERRSGLVYEPEPQTVMGRPRTQSLERKPIPPSKENVEIITAPSIFDPNSEMDFGRHHLYDHEVKQSRSDPEMRVVSLKQVLQVSPEAAGKPGSVVSVSLNGDDGETYFRPEEPMISKKVDTESDITYTGPDDYPQHHPQEADSEELRRRVDLPVKSVVLTPKEPRPFKVIPFLPEDAVEGESNDTHSIFVGPYPTKRPPPSPKSTTQTPVSLSGGKCLYNSRLYENGEMIQKSDPCDLCRCFYGKELCQKQICPEPPSADCIAEKVSGYCCPRFTCGTQDSADMSKPNPPPQKIDEPLRSSTTASPPPPTQPPTSTSSQEIIFNRPVGAIQRRPPQITPAESHDVGLISGISSHDSIEDVYREKSTTEVPKQLSTVRVFVQNPSTPEPSPASTSTGLRKATVALNTRKPTVNKTVTRNPVSFSRPNITKIKIVKTTRRPALQLTTLNSAISENVSAVTSTTKKPNVVKKKVESDNSVWGQLKVSGCNIFGKFYNLNDFVKDLSGPCNVCVCSSQGVECTPQC